MKIIDLLNKIANGEEVPKKIKIGDNKDIFYYQTDINSYKTYNDEYLMSDYMYNTLRLNNEVEILEEEKKIPEKLNKQHFHKKQRQLANKINEIIDYLKSKGE